jgi:hypothetical protein
MTKVLAVYILIELGVVFLAVVSFLFWDKRYRKNHGLSIPAGFEKTNEVTIDPKTAKRFRVYFNSITGERFYHDEGDR